MKSRRVLAVIPARAGSKGIPGKNLRRIAGRSLIGWSIAAALGSRHHPRVVVSTDGEDIAAEARRCGAEVILRPASIAGDSAKSEDALLHVLEALRTREGYQPDLLVFLQCTSPLTLSEDIDGTIDALDKDGADTAVAVVPFHYFLWRHNADGHAVGINHDLRFRPLRQEREPQYLEAGAVYVMKADPFREVKHRFFGRVALHVMPAERRWEIDDPIDLEIAASLIHHQRGLVPDGNNGLLLPASPSAVIFDFDGVMTDDRVMVTDDGREGVLCHRGDGLGLGRLRERGIPLLILSKERNPVVTRRGEKLQIPVRQGIDEKGPELVRWASEAGINLADAIYVGNDINDLECLKLVGWPVAVGDAHPSVTQAARLVLSKPGGAGAVRELCDLILNASATVEAAQPSIIPPGKN